MAGLYGGNKDEFVTCLAALALYDGESEITADNISTLLKASNNTVAPYWPMLFSGLLKNGRIENLIFSASSGGGGDAGGSSGGAATAAPTASSKEEEKPKEKEKPKEEEVDALAGGMSMFGDAGGGGGDY